MPCASGSAVGGAPRAGPPADRRVARRAADGQDQQVDGVADEQQPQQHSGQVALQQQIDPAAGEDADEHQRNEVGGHRAPPELLGHLDVHPGAEAAQHVEHQTDHDQVHAEVEEQCGDELDVAQHRQVDLDQSRRQHRSAQQQRRRRGARRQTQPRAEHLAGIHRQCLAEFVAPAREVAQHQRQPRGQPAREPAAGRVVAGEEEVHRQHHDQREDHPGRDLEHQRAVPRVAQLAAAQPGDVADGPGCRAVGRCRVPTTRGAEPNRLWRNTIDATPVAATSSTEISPRVSQARMSTSSTLTALAPCPRQYAASGSTARSGCRCGPPSRTRPAS